MGVTIFAKATEEGAYSSLYWTESQARQNKRNTPNTDDAIVLREVYVGRVLSTYERNGYSDSDFFAVVWNDATQSVQTIQYGTTRGWTYPCGASVDATEEVQAKFKAFKQAKIAELRAKIAAVKATFPEKGKKIRVVAGRKVPKGTEGIVFWVGECQFKRSRSYYSDVKFHRIGFKDDAGNTYWIDAQNVAVIDESGNQLERYDAPSYYGSLSGLSYSGTESWLRV